MEMFRRSRQQERAVPPPASLPPPRAAHPDLPDRRLQFEAPGGAFRKPRDFGEDARDR